MTADSIRSVSLDYFDSRPVGQMINRFNSDLNMSMSDSECSGYGTAADQTVDMTLPNHAVNVMYTGAGIIGSVILITIAGPYVSVDCFSGATTRSCVIYRWLQYCLAQHLSWPSFSGSTSALAESFADWTSLQSHRKALQSLKTDKEPP